MLHPSYSELIDVLNNETDTDNQITSRYTIVIAAAKRARQLVDGAPMAVKYNGHDKAVSIAISEMNEGKIKIRLNEQAQKENREYEAGGTGYEKKPEEKPTMSLNLDTLDDELDDYDDFDDDLLDTDVDLDLSIVDIDLDSVIDAGLDKDEFDDEEFEEELFPDDDFDTEDGFDD